MKYSTYTVTFVWSLATIVVKVQCVTLNELFVPLTEWDWSMENHKVWKSHNMTSLSSADQSTIRRKHHHSTTVLPQTHNTLMYSKHTMKVQCWCLWLNSTRMLSLLNNFCWNLGLYMLRNRNHAPVVVVVMNLFEEASHTLVASGQQLLTEKAAEYGNFLFLLCWGVTQEKNPTYNTGFSVCWIWQTNMTNKITYLFCCLL